jgi:uncharacterized integral membrane protein (TIGR00697 family)
MYNELVFLLHVLLVGVGALCATASGQSALVAYISVLAILANLFVTKQTILFGMYATCSDAFMIGAVLSLNILQEYYGKERARSAIWISFGLLIFYTCATQIHLWYTPSSVDTMHAFFMAILNPMLRLTVASLAVYFVVQHLDAWLYGLFKARLKIKYLVVRNYASLAITQFADTVLFRFLGLYGIIHNIGHIIIVSYCIKLCAIILVTPFIAFSHKLVRKQ